MAVLKPFTSSHQEKAPDMLTHTHTYKGFVHQRKALGTKPKTLTVTQQIVCVCTLS